METQKIYPLAFSFECFPASDDAAGKQQQLLETCNQLAAVNPCFFSVNDGGGVTTRQRTINTVRAVRDATGIEVAPHIAAIGTNRDGVRALLSHYQQQNIRHLVVVRGDIPSGPGERGDFLYASDLIRFIRAEYGDYFFVEVAAHLETHPQAASAKADLQHFKQKLDAGADAALTQYFYNPDAFFRFIDECEKLGIDQPVVPGVMPITNHHQLLRFSDICGAEIPRWIRQRLVDYGNDVASIRAFGEEVVTDLCERLLKGGAAGLHFYTMNHASPALAIWNNLGLSSEKALRSRR